jgi:hypothetical protein
MVVPSDETVPLGTGGTVLRVPDGVPTTYKQVETPRGPEIRLTVGRRVIQGRTVRWSIRGTVFEMWPGLNGPHVRVYR